MISLEPVSGRRLRAFERVPLDVYRDLPNYRSTEDDVTRLVIGGRSRYHQHADVRCFLVRERKRVVGRVAFIHDRNLPTYVQAAFFEALPGLDGVAETLYEGARSTYPSVPRLVVGLNGHLNYSAGMLLEPFDRAPLFGFPYSPPYYADYFAGFKRRTMVSFRFHAAPFYKFAGEFGAKFDPSPVVVRTMDRSQLRRDIRIYTELNNACFRDHPFWSDRTPEEDYELFHPFRFLLKEENLLFAEIRGEPVGFLLWYPDFNELVSKPGASLGVLDVLRYHLHNPIQSVRLTEIAVRREHRHGPAVAAMVLEMIRAVERGRYRYCEGGFIFEENRSSMKMTLGLISRAFGKKLEPTRRFAVYEA